LKWAVNPVTGVLVKRIYKDKGRGWSCAETSQEISNIAGNQKKLRETQGWFPPQNLQKEPTQLTP
jgi:hypothetical protein